MFSRLDQRGSPPLEATSVPLAPPVRKSIRSPFQALAEPVAHDSVHPTRLDGIFTCRVGEAQRNPPKPCGGLRCASPTLQEIGLKRGERRRVAHSPFLEESLPHKSRDPLKQRITPRKTFPCPFRR